MSRAARTLTSVGLLLLGPPVAFWALVVLKQWNPWHSNISWLGFWPAALVIGLAGVWLLPIRKLYRALVTVPYAAAVFYGLFMLTFLFECFRFSGNCF
jgi:hypothetical protein